MKRLMAVMLCALLMTGCSAVETFEQVDDIYAMATQPEPKQIQLQLPDDAAEAVFAGEKSKMFFCEGYEIYVETLAGGDLNRTIKDITGYDKDQITVIETPAQNDVKRYECVWITLGEEGELVGRMVVIDDGLHHYCVSVSAFSENAGSLQDTWQEILRSVTI